jgi:hypothetical protein
MSAQQAVLATAVAGAAAGAATIAALALTSYGLLAFWLIGATFAVSLLPAFRTAAAYGAAFSLMRLLIWTVGLAFLYPLLYFAVYGLLVRYIVLGGVAQADPESSAMATIIFAVALVIGVWALLMFVIRKRDVLGLLHLLLGTAVAGAFVLAGGGTLVAVGIGFVLVGAACGAAIARCVAR